MLLAIDVGNTQTHVGMFQDDELVEHWRFATVRFATADELATVLAGLLDLRDLRLADVHAAMVSAVVPTLAHEYEQAIERYFGGRGLLVSSDIKSGMPIRIDRPQELGADRLVNAVAAYDRVGGACIAVDFGTAINYDVVSAAGEYLGGVISPGIEISLEALAARAARLPRVDIEEPRHAIGKGTEEAIQAGVVYGFAGQVDAILGRIREELGEEATAIATGGFAGTIVPFCEQVDEVDDRLTLQGLKLIWDRTPPSRGLNVPGVCSLRGTRPAARVRPHPFEVTVEDLGHVAVVRVQGEVDAATAPRMGETVNRLFARNKRVVLDLRNVDFMDLHGLAVMIRATRRARATAAASPSLGPRRACGGSSSSCTRRPRCASCPTARIRSTRPDARYLLHVRSLTDTLDARRPPARQPRRARAARGHRQLVRAPPGQALRRRARGVGDGVELRPRVRRRAHRTASSCASTRTSTRCRSSCSATTPR